MPQVQMIDSTPRQSQQPTPLERTLDSFAKRVRENKETDVLGEIYKRNENNLDNALKEIQTAPGLSPSKRVSSAEQLLQLKKTNLEIQKAMSKANAPTKADSASAKLERDKELDQKEVEFLKDIKGKNYKPTELYIQAREKGIDRARAKDLANLSRMEGREDRLTEKDISSQYDYELKDLDKQLKDLYDDKAKKPILEKREKLKKMRKSDINRYRAGERDFVLSLDEGATAQTPQQDPVITETLSVLSTARPAKDNKGKIVKDKKTGLQFKSDGKQWVLVQTQAP